VQRCQIKKNSPKKGREKLKNRKKKANVIKKAKKHNKNTLESYIKQLKNLKQTTTPTKGEAKDDQKKVMKARGHQKMDGRCRQRARELKEKYGSPL
jgi:hypothetical protein